VEGDILTRFAPEDVRMLVIGKYLWFQCFAGGDVRSFDRVFGADPLSNPIGVGNPAVILTVWNCE
jgi:hypothetical protein